MTQVSSGLIRVVTGEGDRIELIPFDPEWKVRFDMERRILVDALTQFQCHFEHVGSTSIDGLAAKPIIDILGGLEVAPLSAIVPIIQQTGYTYYPDKEEAISDRKFFVKWMNASRLIHLHFVALNGTFWKQHIRFREILKNDERVRTDYSILKARLALQFSDDRDAYTSSKGEFIQRVLALA